MKDMWFQEKIFFYLPRMLSGKMSDLTLKNVGSIQLKRNQNAAIMFSNTVQRAEINSGSLSNCKECFLICRWNLKNTSIHDYFKFFLLKAYLILPKFILYNYQNQKHILILLHLSIMSNLKFLGTISFVLIISLIQNVMDFVYIKKVLQH